MLAGPWWQHAVGIASCYQVTWYAFVPLATIQRRTSTIVDMSLVSNQACGTQYSGIEGILSKRRAIAGTWCVLKVETLFELPSPACVHMSDVESERLSFASIYTDPS